jgi:hypothetical protein
MANKLTIPEDYIWMSYRYCIGRHTIAAHYHASQIAQDAYGKLSNNRTQFMCEDICQEIHNRLHWGSFIDMACYGNIPKTNFKPLDVLYSILDKESIDSYKKISQIKTIQIEWNREKNDFDYSIYYYNDDDPKKNFGRSFYDISNLEIWQQLANLFDLKSHKWCKLIDDSTCEYYECWKHYRTIEGLLKFKKYKIPVNRLNLSVFTYIPEENVKEDNVEPNNE